MLFPTAIRPLLPALALLASLAPPADARPAAGTASLDVVVADASGRPLAGAEVRVAIEDAAGLERETGAVLSGHLLGLQPPREQASSIEAVAPDGRRVVGAPGKDGGYRIAGLAPGEWTVIARFHLPSPAGEWREARAWVGITPGTAEAVQDLDLALGELAATGRTAAGASLPPFVGLATAGAAGGEVVAWTIVHEDRPLRFERLRPGRYRLLGRTTPDGEPVALGEAEVSGEGELAIDLKR